MKQLRQRAVLCGCARVLLVLSKLQRGTDSAAPLLSLLSTNAAAAARASVVFSNLLKALSLTTFLAPSAVLKSEDRSCNAKPEL